MNSESGKRKYEFPFKLYKVLEQMDQQGGRPEIVSWLPSGKGFKIHNIPKFISEILPTYWNGIKYKSFIRNINLYCFQRVRETKTVDHGAYFHPMFQKGDLASCLKIVRPTLKRGQSAGTSRKAMTKNSFSTSMKSAACTRHIEDPVRNRGQMKIEQSFQPARGQNRGNSCSYPMALSSLTGTPTISNANFPFFPQTQSTMSTFNQNNLSSSNLAQTFNVSRPVSTTTATNPHPHQYSMNASVNNNSSMVPTSSNSSIEPIDVSTQLMHQSIESDNKGTMFSDSWFEQFNDIDEGQDSGVFSKSSMNVNQLRDESNDDVKPLENQATLSAAMFSLGGCVNNNNNNNNNSISTTNTEWIPSDLSSESSMAELFLDHQRWEILDEETQHM